MYFSASRQVPAACRRNCSAVRCVASRNPHVMIDTTRYLLTYLRPMLASGAPCDLHNDRSELAYSLALMMISPRSTTCLIRVELHVHWITFYRAMLCVARTMPSQDVCLSVVRASVRLSHAGILSKRQNISSNIFHRRVTTPF